MGRSLKPNTFSEEEGRYLTTEEISIAREKKLKLRIQLISLLLDHKADISITTKDGKNLFDHCMSSQNYDLLYLFASTASFHAQPHLLFSFSPLICNPKIRSTFHFILNNSKITPEIMNIMDYDGYTPFLKFLRDFLSNASSNYQRIYNYIVARLKTLKFQGGNDFSKESLQASYDNYMNFQQEQNQLPPEINYTL